MDIDGRILASWGDDPAAGDRRIKVPGPWFDLAWGDGLLAVFNPGRHMVQFYDDEGNLVNFYGGYDQNDLAKFVGCCNPVSLAFVGDRQIVVSEKGICRIKVLDWDGSVAAVVARPEDFVEVAKRRAFSIDLAVDGESTIFALENHGSTVEIWKPKEGP